MNRMCTARNKSIPLYLTLYLVPHQARGGTLRERWMHAMGLLLLTIEVAMVLMQPTVMPPLACQ